MSVTPTPNYLVGEAVAVSVGGSLMYVKGGSITRSAASINVSNARSAGYQQRKAGMKGSQLSMDLVYNGDSPPSMLIEGVEVTVIFDGVGYETSESLENIISGTPSTPTGRLITGQYLITSVKDAWTAEADYTVSVEAESTGAYTVVDTATGATPTT